MIAGTKIFGGSKDRNAQKTPVDKIIIHPKFQAHNKTNDIAILVLRKDLDFNNLVRPVTLPPHGANVPDEKEGIISGWGVSENGNVGRNLTFAKTTTFDTAKCKKIYIMQQVTDEMFCARADNVTFCFGDYGGPYVIDNVLHGIMSWGGPCTLSTFPGVYTRVASYIDWIRDEISKTGYK